MNSPLPEFSTQEDLENSPEDGSDFAMFGENYKKNIIYNVDNSKKKNFSPKIVFSALLLVALGTLAYGFYSLSSNIYKSSDIAEQQEIKTPETDSLVDEIAKQKQLDTDKDGLNDYEEVNVYGTSPYLTDTDSDGYDDKTEVDKGHDPLCPTLDNCRVDWAGKTANSANTTTANSANLNNANNANEITNNANSNSGDVSSTGGQTLSAEDLQALNNLTVEEVRELLKTQGQISEEELSAIDDATLMEIYKEALAGQE